MKQLDQKIRALIAQGHTAEALDLLDAGLRLEKSSLHSDLILLKGTYESTAQKLRAQTLSDNDAQTNINKINSSILELSSRFEREKRPERNRKRLFVWVAAGALAAILAIIYLYQRYDTARKEALNDRVAELVLTDLFVDTYTDYELAYQDSIEAKRAPVLQSAQSVRNQLEIIDDKDLELESRLFKYIGLELSYNMMGLLSRDRQEQLEYSDRAYQNAEKAEACIQEIDQLSDANYRSELRGWVDEQRHELRILAEKFLAAALNYQSGGHRTEEEIKTMYKKLSSSNVIVGEGYERYPIVRWLAAKNIIDLKDSE